MKRIFYLLLFATFILQSCGKSDDATGGSFSVTASTGTTKTLKLSTGTYGVGIFNYSLYNYPAVGSTQQVFDIGGLVDYPNTTGGNSQCSVELIYNPPIVINKAYTAIEGSSNSIFIHFEDWLDSDNSSMNKKTIVFTDFNYPGHIAGSVTGYDTNGKLIAKGVFDFTSTKAAQ